MPQTDAPAGPSSNGASAELVEVGAEKDTVATTVITETETVEALVAETIPVDNEAVNTISPRGVPASDGMARGSVSTPPIELAQIVSNLQREEVVANSERVSANASRMSPSVADQPIDQLEGPSARLAMPTTINPALINVRPASELLGQPSHRGEVSATPSPKASSKKRRRSDVPAAPGTTPLRQELLRSQEKRQRTVERQTRDGSPDKIPAFVGIAPRIPRPSKGMTPAPPQRPARTPSPALTPAERHEKILQGSRIVSDIAAQYRAKVGVLTRKYGIGPKEIAAATREIKEAGRAGRATGLDWDRLDSVLAQKYGS